MPDGVSRAAEARRFARYLAGESLDDRACAHYDRWHEHAGVAAHGDRIDGLLLWWASLGSVGMALADAYAARVRRGALLRKKLVVVLALLETSTAHVELDRPMSSGPVGFWVRMIGRGMFAAVTTLLAFVLIGPCHLIAAVLPGGAKPS